MERSTAKLTISIIAGLVVVPLAAVMAVAVMADSPPTDTTLAGVAEAGPEVQQVVFGAVAEATSDDLAAACGPAGIALVSAEADGTITPLQQAALDALRPICEGQGTPLPPKAGPAPLFQTVTRTVVAAGAPTGTESGAAPETTQAGTTPAGDQQGATTTTQPSGSTSSTTQPVTESWESQYYNLHDQAEDEIADAIAAGGDAGLINEAQSLLKEAESKASQGEWHDAAEKAWEALKMARAAVSGGGDD